MTDLILSSQQAVVAALAADAAVQSLLGSSPVRLYDHVPPGAVFPYAVVGGTHVTPYDTHSEKGFEQVITLEIYSRYRGGKEAKDIFQAFYNVLHRAVLVISGGVFLSSQLHSVDFVLGDDGLTYHAAARFAVIVQGS